MKKSKLPLKITLAILFCTALSAAHAQTFEWAAANLGKIFMEGEGSSITVDSLGNVYIVGSFEDTMDFDPGIATLNLISAGNSDVFVQKLNASGKLVWAKRFGGVFSDRGASIKLDASGNLYTTGYFRGTVDFDPGSGISNLTSSGLADIFIQKLDSSGNFIWAKRLGGWLYDDYGSSITVDLSGNVYVTGKMSTTIFSQKSIFVQKLDASGNFIWLKNFGGFSSSEAGLSITTDFSGNVYTTGYFEGTVDFDPGVGIANLTSSGGWDVFIQKLDSSGNLLWAKSFGGASNDRGYSIAVDHLGNVFTTGYFDGTVDFDPGAGVFNLTPVGQRDIFIQKLDSSGNFLWAKAFGGADSDEGNSLTLDTSGNVYTIGIFWQTVDFNPGAGVFNLTSMGQRDIFIQKLNNSGDFLWARKIGGPNSDYGNDIYVDINNNIYLTGRFNNTVDFDPGVGTAYLTAVGASDVFVQKMSPCAPNDTTINLTACDFYVWSNTSSTYTSSGIYSDTLFNVSGCDSIVNLNLTIKNSSNTTQSITACNSFTWSVNSNVYTSSGIYSDTLVNISGCDSIINLNLTIKNSSNTFQTVTACGSYTWSANSNVYTSSGMYSDTLVDVYGCDSIVNLNLTITNGSNNFLSLTACDSYTWSVNSNTYTSSGIYTDTLVDIYGCDSIVNLNLTINNSSNTIQTVTACNSYTWPVNSNTYTESSNHSSLYTNSVGCDSILTLNLTINKVSDISTSFSTFPGGVLITANNAAASYQWLDCDNNYAVIAGETGQTFATTINGNYAVEVTENDCADTSDCMSVIVGILENTFNQAIKIFPNPTSGTFTIDLGDVNESIKLSIIDARGRLVHSENFITTSLLKIALDQPAGLYFIELQSGEKTAKLKLIKE